MKKVFSFTLVTLMTLAIIANSACISNASKEETPAPTIEPISELEGYYKNSIYGFSLNYPPEWVIQEGGPNDPAEDTYIGNFFKIRKGTGTAVNESMGDPLEDDFDFNIDYTYGDSTLITIKPKAAYDSEIWYFVEIDPRIQDVNRQSID